MEPASQVIEYKCPCCGAGLSFGEDTQRMTCEYCDNEFDLETVKAFNDSLSQPNSCEFIRDEEPHPELSEDEQGQLHSFVCPSCGGEIMSDEHTVATFCPYCANPSIMPGRVAGGLRPDGVIPFKKTKEDAQAAFLSLCKGKPLLPKGFTEEQQLEKITGIYVPFWLHDCHSSLNGRYSATRVQTWSDSNYIYTKTDYYMLLREADASFAGIPMDGSSKMEDTFMESIEPFDYSQIVDFDTAYLSGFFADKYDVESSAGDARIRERVEKSMDDMLQSTFLGYATVAPTGKQLNVKQDRPRYILLPVWILNTRYRDQIYTFAMNGQTGKMTGILPICPKRSAMWFAGISAAVAALAAVVQLIAL